MDEISEEYSALMDSPDERDIVADHFTFLGIEYLLKGQTLQDKMLATAYAFGVVFYSYEFYGDGNMETVGKDACEKLSLQGNDMEETIKFFSHRINCSCLKDKYSFLESATNDIVRGDEWELR